MAGLPADGDMAGGGGTGGTGGGGGTGGAGGGGGTVSCASGGCGCGAPVLLVAVQSVNGGTGTDGRVLQLAIPPTGPATACGPQLTASGALSKSPTADRLGAARRRPLRLVGERPLPRQRPRSDPRHLPPDAVGRFAARAVHAHPRRHARRHRRRLRHQRHRRDRRARHRRCEERRRAQVVEHHQQHGAHPARLVGAGDGARSVRRLAHRLRRQRHPGAPGDAARRFPGSNGRSSRSSGTRRARRAATRRRSTRSTARSSARCGRRRRPRRRPPTSSTRSTTTAPGPQLFGPLNCTDDTLCKQPFKTSDAAPDPTAPHRVLATCDAPASNVRHVVRIDSAGCTQLVDGSKLPTLTYPDRARRRKRALKRALTSSCAGCRRASWDWP